MQKKTPRRSSAECLGKLSPLFHMATPFIRFIFKNRFPALFPYGLINFSANPVQSANHGRAFLISSARTRYAQTACRAFQKRPAVTKSMIQAKK
jgi:hypothetical protein